MDVFVFGSGHEAGVEKGVSSDDFFDGTYGLDELGADFGVLGEDVVENPVGDGETFGNRGGDFFTEIVGEGDYSFFGLSVTFREDHVGVFFQLLVVLADNFGLSEEETFGVIEERRALFFLGKFGSKPRN